MRHFKISATEYIILPDGATFATEPKEKEIDEATFLAAVPFRPSTGRKHHTEAELIANREPVKATAKKKATTKAAA